MTAVVTALLRHLPWLLTTLLLLTLVATVPAFQRPTYWLALAPQYFPVAALALALTPIVLTGGIDLSVGSLTVLSSIVAGILWRDLGWPIGLALAGGVTAGMLGGLGNGLLVSRGILPLVATLATRELYRGLSWSLSGGPAGIRFPEELGLGRFWARPVLGLPVALWGLAALGLVSYLVIHHTWMGRMLYALGDNAHAARNAGVPVRSLQLALYTWSGFVAGLCGVAVVFEYGAAKADAERSLELLAIAGVVMGGIRVTGGAGHIGGTVLGTVTICALLAGLSRVASDWRDTVTGAVLITVAIAGEAAARRLARQGPATVQGSTR